MRFQESRLYHGQRAGLAPGGRLLDLLARVAKRYGLFPRLP